MIAAPLAASPPAKARFNAPYDRWSPLQRLRHFHERNHVAFFPVPDQEQVQRARIDAVLDNRFTFNNETHDLPPGFDWHVNPSDDLEWQIMLHKFYFATGLGMAHQETGDEAYLAKWIELTESWIETVQPDLLAGRSMFNDPLFVAVEGRRIQNWISAYYHFVATNRHRLPPAAFHETLLASIEAQVAFLCGHLAPSRNHRTLELWAVFMAAVVFPEFQAAKRWQRLALEGLHQNILEDLLPDGVQCELSTHYHHIVLRNYLSFRRLAQQNNIRVMPAVDEALREALEFAIHVHKPDGTIPALSDADVDSHLDLIALGAELYDDDELAYVASRGKKGRAPATHLARFADSGYVTMRSGWGERGEAYQDERYLVFDCGPIGAGNHGHLDLLNIEVAAFGRSLIVDPGRYTYREPREDSGEINWRARFRGTAYHNTVTVDGKNQARYVRAGKARRCKIKGPHPDHELRCCASHARLDVVHGIARSHEYDAVHERIIMFVDRTYWLVVDRLTSPSEHHYDLRSISASRLSSRSASPAAGSITGYRAPTCSWSMSVPIAPVSSPASFRGPMARSAQHRSSASRSRRARRYSQPSSIPTQVPAIRQSSACDRGRPSAPIGDLYPALTSSMSRSDIGGGHTGICSAFRRMGTISLSTARA
ncbi:MAG: heparinase II/III family protein [Alphaproteobacteria bacterium]|nr:heparinase II/III family protein [Alphaproteobacteria bacterium]